MEGMYRMYIGILGFSQGYRKKEKKLFVLVLLKEIYLRL